jgi:hypothetical protein
VVAALQDTLEIKNDDIFKSATGLAGGAGLAGDSGSGAYIGAILVLSSLVGRDRNNFSNPGGVRLKNLQIVRKFREKFIQEYGSVVCRNIQNKILGRYYYLPTLRSMTNSTMLEPTTSIALRSWARQPNG